MRPGLKEKGGAEAPPERLRPLDPSAFDAGCAGLDPGHHAVDQNPGGLEVGLPDMLGVPGGVADPVAGRGLLPAYIAFPGHDGLLVCLRKRRQHIRKPPEEINPRRRPPVDLRRSSACKARPVHPGALKTLPPLLRAGVCAPGTVFREPLRHGAGAGREGFESGLEGPPEKCIFGRVRWGRQVSTGTDAVLREHAEVPPAS